jgi:hypothetical protein
MLGTVGLILAQIAGISMGYSVRDYWPRVEKTFETRRKRRNLGMTTYADSLRRQVLRRFAIGVFGSTVRQSAYGCELFNPPLPPFLRVSKVFAGAKR